MRRIELTPENVDFIERALALGCSDSMSAEKVKNALLGLAVEEPLPPPEVIIPPPEAFSARKK